jgi:hypothetical protein
MSKNDNTDFPEAIKDLSAVMRSPLESLLQVFGEPHSVPIFEKYESIDDPAVLQEGNQLFTTMNTFLNLAVLLNLLLKDQQSQNSTELVKFFAERDTGEVLVILLTQLHRHVLWEMHLYKESSPRISELAKFESSPAIPPFGEVVPRGKFYPLEELAGIRSKNAPVFFFFLNSLPLTIKGILACRVFSLFLPQRRLQGFFLFSSFLLLLHSFSSSLLFICSNRKNICCSPSSLEPASSKDVRR